MKDASKMSTDLTHKNEVETIPPFQVDKVKNEAKLIKPIIEYKSSLSRVVNLSIDAFGFG